MKQDSLDLFKRNIFQFHVFQIMVTPPPPTTTTTTTTTKTRGNCASLTLSKLWTANNLNDANRSFISFANGSQEWFHCQLDKRTLHYYWQHEQDVNTTARTLEHITSILTSPSLLQSASWSSLVRVCQVVHHTSGHWPCLHCVHSCTIVRRWEWVKRESLYVYKGNGHCLNLPQSLPWKR